MDQPVQNVIAGRDCRFLEDGFVCQDWPDPVRYEDVTKVCVTEGSNCVEVGFKTPKGKSRKVYEAEQGQALQTMLKQKVPGASVTNREQTAWEVSGGWVVLGLSLAGIAVLLIVLNTVGRGASVTLPIWMAPFVLVGSFLGVGTLVAIAAGVLVLCGIAALLSLRKRKHVWELNARG